MTDKPGQRRTKQTKAIANVARILLESSNKKEPSGQVSRVMENRLSLTRKGNAHGFPRNRRKRNKACSAFNVFLLSLSYAKIIWKKACCLHQISYCNFRGFKSLTSSKLSILHIPVTSDPTGNIWNLKLHWVSILHLAPWQA